VPNLVDATALEWSRTERRVVEVPHGKVRVERAVGVVAQHVRRLMPVECERLQGFPDDWTLVPYRGKAADQCADTPRHKALGNSIAVPVLRWIGERIAMVDALPAAELVHPEGLAKALSDSELVEKCVQGFRDLREALPYLREERHRFSQPGRRVPVPGNPTWTEWVQVNLHVTVSACSSFWARERNLAKQFR
jgi:hypothetical protein